MINVNIRYKGKEFSTTLPQRSNELTSELKKAGIDLPYEKLKLRSSARDQYLIGLYTNDPLGDVIIDRLEYKDIAVSVDIKQLQLQHSIKTKA